jgi:aspartate/methionine/tyrosine aminotransferase
MKPASRVFTGMPTTIFEVMSGLARQHEAINLGQGFPDVDGPEDIRRVAAEALLKESNQYPPMMGIPELRQAVAESNRRFYGLDVDWRTEVMVTSGATEAIADAIMALVEPGDEVVLIEPLYDCYLPMVQRAGGIPRLVRLAPPDWSLDREKLNAAFSPRTKAILMNNPTNPAAKVYTEEELGLIAEFVIANDAYAICDEVYEHIVFDGHRHIPLMTMPGMRERTVRIGSAGKTFSLTGWKVGYVTAPAKLLDPIAKAHQFTTFTTPPDLQRAVAYGLAKDDSYYAGLIADQQQKRDRLAKGLASLGFTPLPCAGTYFITTDVSHLGLGGDDLELCKRMVVEAGVAAVPISAFYASNPPSGVLRFCFCKRDSVLDEGVARLSTWLKARGRAVA